MNVTTTIAKVEWPKTEHPDGSVTTRPVLTLACGHLVYPACQFSYTVGNRWTCYGCNHGGKDCFGNEVPRA
jgi:hypothetical protein